MSPISIARLQYKLVCDSRPSKLDRRIGSDTMDRFKVWQGIPRPTAILILMLVEPAAWGAQPGALIHKREFPALHTASFAVGQPCDNPATYPAPAYPKPDLTSAQISALFSLPGNSLEWLQNLRLIFARDLLAQPTFYSDDVLLKALHAQSIDWVDATHAGEDNIIRATRVARLTARVDGDAPIEISIGENHKCLNERPDPANTYKKIPPHTYDAGYVHIRLPETVSISLDSIRNTFGDPSGEYDVSCAAQRLRYVKKLTSPLISGRYVWNAIEFTVREPDYARCPPGPGRAWFGSDTISAISIRLIEEDYTHPLPNVY